MNAARQLASGRSGPRARGRHAVDASTANAAPRRRRHAENWREMELDTRAAGPVHARRELYIFRNDLDSAMLEGMGGFAVEGVHVLDELFAGRGGVVGVSIATATALAVAAVAE